jgi:hypothetical protein
VGYALAWPGATIAGATLDVHTLAVASLLLLMGNQALTMGLLVKTHAIESGFLPADSFHMRFFRFATLERGLLLSGLAFLAWLALLGYALNLWQDTGYGHLSYPQVMRLVIPGVTLAALGFQNFLASWFVSILGLRRR